jgi:hypothetical protein
MTLWSEAPAKPLIEGVRNAASTRGQQSLVTFLRDRRQIGTYQRPGISIVIAAKQLAAGGPAKNLAFAI